jgi:signal transduction histidine kinase
MSLKKRLIQLLLFSGFILGLSFLLSFKIFMIPPLNERKLSHISNLRKKFEIALSIEEQNITVLCHDWADSVSMAAYVETPTRDFELSVFPDNIFLEDQLDIVLVLDDKMNIIFFKSYWQDKEFVDFKDLKISGDIKKIAIRLMNKHATVNGIINSTYEPILTVSHPITPKIENTPIPGVLILGKFIDRRMTKRLSLYGMENLEILPLNFEQMNAFYINSMGRKDFHYNEEDDTFFTYHLLKDIYNKPVLILNGTSDNSIFNVINKHTLAFITIILFISVLLGVLLYHYLDRFMIKRIQGITDTMSRIEGLEDLSVRLAKDKQKDEISHLISSLNLTLDKLENEKINRENAEKAMVHQGKLASIGRLSSNIAHEINNPLLAISNSIQVIKKNVKVKDELLKDAIDISESEIDRIRKIIEGLLDFHRSDKEFTSLRVKDVIKQTLEVLKWSNKLKSTKIILKMGEDCHVYGSSVKLEETFMNFTLNAVDAMEGTGGKGKLKIEVLPAKDDNLVEIHFIDNGPGLPPEVKESLFEPFVSTKENKGVGLGLYIAYKIINLHHGSINYNQNYKEGAHFIIKLPASRRSLKNG